MSSLKAIPWSYSRLALWKQCKKKWQYKYIHKIPDKAGPAAVRGSTLHSLAEGYVMGSLGLHKMEEDFSGMEWQLLSHKVTAENTAKFIEYLRYFREEKLKHNLSTEMKVTFNWDFKPVKDGDLDTYGVAIVDVLLDIDDELFIFDYKTGKYREEEHKLQAKTYAYVIYKMLGVIPKTIFIYIDQGFDKEFSFTEADMADAENFIESTIEEIEMMDAAIYPETRSKLCDYCGYKNICRGPAPKVEVKTFFGGH